MIANKSGALKSCLCRCVEALNHKSQRWLWEVWCKLLLSRDDLPRLEECLSLACLLVSGLANKRDEAKEKNLEGEGEGKGEGGGERGGGRRERARGVLRE